METWQYCHENVISFFFRNQKANRYHLATTEISSCAFATNQDMGPRQQRLSMTRENRQDDGYVKTHAGKIFSEV